MADRRHDEAFTFLFGFRMEASDFRVVQHASRRRVFPARTA